MAGETPLLPLLKWKIPKFLHFCMKYYMQESCTSRFGTFKLVRLGIFLSFFVIGLCPLIAFLDVIVPKNTAAKISQTI